MNINPKIRWALSLFTGAAIVALAAGCQDGNQRHGDQFAPDQEERDLHRIENAQAARGRSQDATLHACHFSNDQINTLGQDRLDLMLRDGGVYVPLVVYLDVPQDDQLARRQQSVAMFLKDRGVRDDQIKLQMGSNPKNSTAVEPLVLPGEGESQDKQKAGSVSPTMDNTEHNPINH